ncbi:hypothetical protein M231_01801 [Tremella mesenterica]|uniref:AMP-dependent synthetase/ligase domain-containing protein n=1 Tax=Tremella mesenterica TaxID=5217 RepID=A0A4Q1BSE4_TREME|nr:hypothetical protein M231_01801 [Tremella mesenterica]
MSKLACVPLPSDPSIRRCHLSVDKLLTRPAGEEVVIVGDIYSYASKKYGDKIACYYRDVIGVVEEIKKVDRDGKEKEKVWKYFTLSTPKPVTYNQLDQIVTTLTSGLINLGFTNPSLPIPSRPRVSIYADTCLNWQLMAQTFARLGHTITTAYTTLGEEGLIVSLEEPEVELVFCGEGQLNLVGKVLEKVEKVKWVVYDDKETVDTPTLEQISKTVESRGGKIITFTALKQLGLDKPVRAEDLGPKPTEEDLFCIMYTSGSTGPPKGVMLSNANVISSLAGSIKLFETIFRPESDLLMAYLPLAHILEQFLEYTFLLLGVPLAYASVKTLLDDSVRNCQGDFAAYKPTLFAGVPAVFEMIRKGMMKKISDAGPIVGTVFSFAVWGKKTLPWPLNAIIDRVLFGRVKQATGGRVRMTVCGGGALSESTQIFLSTVLAPIMQGYGLTETCGMSTITTPDRWSVGSVGTLGPSTELKLHSLPELGYLTNVNPPQGEIWLRGSNVCKGYFNRPELTAEAFTDDGWLKTGDIGRWSSDGTLRIVDRIKHLVKLQNGEYLALDKVESIYKACDVVMMICIVAPPQAERPIAIVYPHDGNLRNYLSAAKLPSNGTPQSWAKDEKVVNIILGQLLAVGQRAGLSKAEWVRDVIMTDEEWSPENGLLTPSMKLARTTIAQRYKDEIEASLAKQ